MICYSIVYTGYKIDESNRQIKSLVNNTCYFGIPISYYETYQITYNTANLFVLQWIIHFTILLMWHFGTTSDDVAVTEQEHSGDGEVTNKESVSTLEQMSGEITSNNSEGT